MSYQTWHNYGYGIRVSGIKEAPVERLRAMLSHAPKFENAVNQWLQDNGIDTPTYEDYLRFDDTFYLGLATLMRETIEEAEGIEFIACEDFDNENYLIYPPHYPWELSKDEADLTEDAVRGILDKYSGILTDEEIEIGYQSAENGG